MGESKKVLVLGAGLVAGPLIRYLSQCGHHLRVASRTQAKADALVQGIDSAKTLAVDVTDPAALETIIPEADIVVSLVPHTYHMGVANACLRFRKNLVTTSYIKPEMEALGGQVKSEKLLFLNEIGLDPGIDHMSAMQVIDRVRDNGGRVVGFSSNCGGLPAPEAATGPLGYKLSWSPRGVVLAGRNNARYLQDSEPVDISWRDLFAHVWNISVDEVGQYEVYTNRDCLGYIQKYGLEGIRDMFRGTIRTPGWCRLWKRIADLGYLADQQRDDLAGHSYVDLTASLIGGTVEGLAEQLSSFFRLTVDDEVIGKMQWLGMLSDAVVPEGTTTCLDALVHLLSGRLEYRPGERDMVILQHRFTVEYPDRREVIQSQLVDYGIPGGDSAMARTVSLPAAIAADLMLQDKIRITGVHGPVHKVIYEPVMEKLESFGIRFSEKVIES